MILFQVKETCLIITVYEEIRCHVWDFRSKVYHDFVYNTYFTINLVGWFLKPTDPI